MKEFFYKYFNICFATLGGAVGYFLGGWDMLLIALVTFMAIDYITGLMSAYSLNELDSKIGFKGIFKKVMELLIVALAVVLDRVMGHDGMIIRSAVCFFYIANEGLSILENTAKLGVSYPDVVLNALKQIRWNEKTEKSGEILDIEDEKKEDK